MANPNGIQDHNGTNADKLAAGYKSIDRKSVHPELFKKLQAAAEKGIRLHILDIGCGSGDDAIAMARLGHKVIGVEPSDLRKIAIRDHAHPDIDYRNGQLPNLKAAIHYSETFDVILMSAVLQYVDPAEAPVAFEQMALSLKPEGEIFLSYPSPPSRPHQYEITPDDLKRMIHKANENLPSLKKLSAAFQMAVKPDSRGRKSLDGRALNFYSCIVQPIGQSPKK